MSRIAKIRDAIKKVDAEILKLLAERRMLSREIIKSKDLEHKPVKDPKREEELLVRIIEIGKEEGLEPGYITKIYEEIISDSVKIQSDYLKLPGRK